jgi:hypothetical protein
MVFARDETNATESGYGLETELADPDPQVIDAAADAAYDAQRNQGVASLAARGLARSGGVGQVLNESLGNYQRGMYEDNQGLQDKLGQAFQSFLGQQQGLQKEAAAATQGANADVIAMIKAGRVGQGATTAPAATTKTAAPLGGYSTASAGIASANAPMPKPYKPPAAPTASAAISSLTACCMRAAATRRCSSAPIA